MRYAADPAGTTDFHLPDIVDLRELDEMASRGGVDPRTAVRVPNMDPEVYEGDALGGYWIPMPSPPAPRTDIVWHYTDAGGAIGLISSGEVWATSMNCLNDTEEFAHGIRVLEDEVLPLALDSRWVHPMQKEFMRDAVQLARESADVAPLYAFCASEQPDSLSQWRGYGSGVSYAVGFSVDREIMAMVDTEMDPRRLPRSGPWASWGRVLYSVQEQRDLLMRGLSFCAAATIGPDEEEEMPGQAVVQASGVLIGLIAYCKHDAFRDESEVRMVTFAPHEGEAVQYRSSRFGITPYVRLTRAPARASSESAWWTVGKDHASLPVGAVRVGPTPHSEPAAHGMRLLLNTRGYQDVPVHQSTAPFR